MVEECVFDRRRWLIENVPLIVWQRSAVQHLPCKTSQKKNLHQGSALVLYNCFPPITEHDLVLMPKINTGVADNYLDCFTFIEASPIVYEQISKGIISSITVKNQTGCFTSKNSEG